MKKLLIETLPVFVQNAIHTFALASSGRGQSTPNMKQATKVVSGYISNVADKLVGNKNYKTGKIMTREEAIDLVSNKVRNAYNEEETAVNTDSYTTWNTREDVGDSELCLITYFARNTLENPITTDEEDQFEDDGREYINTIDWNERKEREDELLDIMRSGKFRPTLILQRAYNLAKIEVISWKCYRLLRILTPQFSKRYSNDDELNFF